MRIPAATYRLQFNRSFRFPEARALVPYLASLGISDVYASPILRATQSSTHGYDVTNPDELNPELGTWEDFTALTAEVQAHHMGWLQDIVPNHMAYSSENRMLMDVFEHGQRSRYWEFFDIFRDHPDPELRTKLLAPFLAAPLAEVLQRGELRLALDGEGFALRYFDWRFPLHLASYASVLEHGREQQDSMGDDPQMQACVALADTFACLSEMADSPDKKRRLAEARQQLARLNDEHPMTRRYIDGVLESFNRPPQGPVEESPLYKLLQEQIVKPVFWQTSYERINYRRFFYLSDFIALRVEEPQVFDRIHRKILELTRAGHLTGLRVDHIDGLYNPREYLLRLREAAPETYMVVEKILELDESLPTGWPIQGTSGYKFCNYVNGIFCQRENEEAFTRIYHEFIGAKPDYARMLYEEKRKILEWRMAGEVAYLAHLASQVSTGGGPARVEPMRRTLTALMAALPVYRTYVDAHHFTDQDRAFLTEAIAKARAECPDCGQEIDHITELLLLDPHHESDPRLQGARQHFLMRFQQFTGPAMAKGFEDTLLYVYNRFISLNEVGGDPTTFGLSLDRFHRFNQARAANWPHAMNATSTHDSKRSEDVRARLNVLSEIPDRWEQAVRRWAALNEPHRQRCQDGWAPDRNDEYLLYQTLVGALPFEEGEYDDFRQRVQDYMVKAVREAKAHGNWVQPDEHYEAACVQFVASVLDPTPRNRFWSDLRAFQREISDYGIYNSLAQTTLKMTCPGLPDFYRGAELWDLSLVDPDNRRPVDFDWRARVLRELQETPPSEYARLAQTLLQSRNDGRIKFFLILQGLRVRREHRDLFDAGAYLPASVAGSKAPHIVAFFRAYQGAYALTVVPRFVTSLVPPGGAPTGRKIWEDTRIGLPADAPSDWHDAITGRSLSAWGESLVGDILAEFPVAILLGQPNGSEFENREKRPRS